MYVGLDLHKARQGISMTSRCEFGRGNDGLAHVAMGTASGSNPLVVAAQMRIRGRQRKRTQCSTVRSRKEGRAGLVYAKAITVPSRSPCDDTASSVSRWSYAEKAMGGNLGDHAASGRLKVRPVARPINPQGETVGEALRGVRWAHTTREIGDSITPMEGRGPTCGQGRSGPTEGAIPERVRGL